MGILVIAIISLNALLSIPFLSIAISILVSLAVIELASIAQKATQSIKLTLQIILQTAILITADMSIWLMERTIDNWPLIFFAVALPVVCQNSLAYYIGSKLLPRTHGWFKSFLKFRNFRHSHNKYLGVVIASSAVSLIFALVFAIFQMFLAAAAAAIGAIFAALGDYLESQLKRTADVKDSGELLRDGKSIIAKLERAVSSHGGFLDRFDSLSLCYALCLPVILISS
jgi:CDP-diglyceride synthetase